MHVRPESKVKRQMLKYIYIFSRVDKAKERKTPNESADENVTNSALTVETLESATL